MNALIFNQTLSSLFQMVPPSPTSPTWDSDSELLDLLEMEETYGQLITGAEPSLLAQTAAGVSTHLLYHVAVHHWQGKIYQIYRQIENNHILVLSLSVFPFNLQGNFYVCGCFSTPSFYHFWRSPCIPQQQYIFEGAHFYRFNEFPSLLVHCHPLSLATGAYSFQRMRQNFTCVQCVVCTDTRVYLRARSLVNDPLKSEMTNRFNLKPVSDLQMFC